MKRFLLTLILFATSILLLRRLAGLFSSGGRPTARQGATTVAPTTELVRDRVCNTFLPKDRALTLRAAGEVRYFCSEECRRCFRSGGARGSDAA